MRPTTWLIFILLASIWSTFLFFLFLFDFRRKCRSCGSRLRESFSESEVIKHGERALVCKRKYRRCLRCGDVMLFRKKVKVRTPKGKSKRLSARKASGKTFE
jgi:hypothetical protein